MGPIDPNTPVVNQICEILARVLRVPPETVMHTSAIRALPNADSVMIIEAVIAIEDHFGIELPDALVFRIDTVLDVVATVESLRAERAPGAREQRIG